MTIKDIIKHTAMLLDERGLYDYVKDKESLTDDGSEEYRAVSCMAELANNVINEVATQLIPIRKIDIISGARGYILLNTLSATPLKIISTFDAGGRTYDFSVTHEKIVCSTSVSRVAYHYVPKAFSFNETFDFNEEQVPMRILAYGLASEYCLTMCRVDECAMWREKFQNSAFNTDIETPPKEDDTVETEEENKEIVQKNVTIKTRRWL